MTLPENIKLIQTTKNLISNLEIIRDAIMRLNSEAVPNEKKLDMVASIDYIIETLKEV